MSTEPSRSSSTQSSTNPPMDETYPKQLHAGKVGYGPNFSQGTSMVDKIAGLVEEIHGKVKHKPELVKEGHERRTGEAKRRKMLGLDDNEDPLAAAPGESSGEGESKSLAEPHSPTPSKSTKDQTSSSSAKDAGPPPSAAGSARTHSPTSSSVA